ncbi:MAG: hypothetical protein P1V35_04855 [Planctomycetota bacterium]|nr:hypothetical protein [Planctomycetota bacterium]
MISCLDTLTFKKVLLSLVATLLVSCATYVEKTSEAMGAFRNGQFDRAEALFADKERIGSTFLSGAEAGLVCLTAGDFEGAIEYLTAAAAFSEEAEDASLVDPESLVESLASWTLSEGTTDYMGEGYERVMVHACLGLAYLAQGKVDDLLVEVRRSNDLLAAEESLYETEYQAGGFAHFLSALGYELRGEYDEAYIDYQAMNDKGVGKELVGPMLVRLSQAMRRSEDINRFVDEFGQPEPIPQGAAKIILLAGVGLGPMKHETRLDVPTGDGIFSWAVPSFSRQQNFDTSLEISTDDLAASSVIVEDVNGVATKNLDDRIAMLSVKSAVRGALKVKLTRELEKKHGSVGFLAGQLFSMATERADLRSWLTLPSTWQAARLYPQPGITTIRLRAVGGESIELGTFDLAPGETIFVLARNLGPRLHAHVLGGSQVDLSTPEPMVAPNPSSEQ